MGITINALMEIMRCDRDNILIINPFDFTYLT